jgi:hypothetical protein
MRATRRLDERPGLPVVVYEPGRAAKPTLIR